jgi:hypothetical protein
MPQHNQVKAIVQAWYPGQFMALRLLKLIGKRTFGPAPMTFRPTCPKHPDPNCRVWEQWHTDVR